MLQVFVLVRETRWDLVVRKHDVLLQLQDLHFVHDQVRVVQGFRQIAESSTHLRLGLEEELVVVKGEAFAFLAYLIIAVVGLRCALLFAGVDAQKNVVRVRILLIHIVAVVAGDDRHVVFARPLHQYGVHLLLLRDPVALDLHVIIVPK